MSNVFVSLQYVIDRVRQPRSRADDVRRLRERFVTEGRDAAPDSEEAAAAQRLRALREEMSRATGEVVSCTRCAIGRPPPHGHFAGGHCCGLQTEDAFNDDEVSALHQTGTRPRHLQAPDGDHAGCAFRGETGCSLKTADRPNLCLRYFCPELARELHASGRLDGIEALGQEMETVYLRFITLRKQRLDRADGL